MPNTETLTESCRALIRWYEQNHRDLPWRHNCTPYRILVSEIMLQQTRVDTVLRYYDRFLTRLPDFPDLAHAPEELLMTLWQGLGYYRRVRNLQKAARQVMENHQGHFPENYDDITKLAGIGEYTAGAISSIAFNLPYPAVDGNVIRVISRLTATDLNSTDIRQMLLPVYKIIQNRNSLTQSLMELGATVCLPGGRPECLLCPWRDCCLAHHRKEELSFPKPPPKILRRKENLTVFILECGAETAFRKRNDNAGVLAGMWELPNCPGHLSEKQIRDMFPEGELLAEGSRRHIFTHLEWNMHFFRIRLPRKTTDCTWKSPSECPLPTAFRKLLIP